ncbi:hypothetical protein QQS21_001287 [Conoideocrella luteorostrata]|uniref:Rhodopsin domain-containing protein n=1 Tax=Conoideocrella luteorostrata TaxID=1105319 RepID=A0AAJ0CXC8_9HYPO|nr:hypothetical protein QQS21_001287 [Conoideocrella luteorostrata]
MDNPVIPPPPKAAVMAAAAKEFNRELWTLLFFGTLATVLRTYSRVRAMGFLRLQPDDYLAWVAMTLYGIESGLAYSVGVFAHGLANNGMTDAHRAALPTNSEEHGLRVVGSIIQLCGWSTYSTLLWSLKVSWLFFYMRLTEGLGRRYRTRIRIYIGFGLVLVTWLAVLLNIFLGCRPFRRYWQINPDPGIKNPVQGAQQAGVWAVRETFVAVVTTNLPLVFTLVKGWLAPLFGSIGSALSSKLSSRKLSGGMARIIRTFGQGSRSWRGPSTANPIPDFTANESDECIHEETRMKDMKRSSEGGQGLEKGPTKELNIQKMVQDAVVSEDATYHARGDSYSKTMDRRPWDRAHQGEHSAYAQGPAQTPKCSS